MHQTILDYLANKSQPSEWAPCSGGYSSTKSSADYFFDKLPSFSDIYNLALSFYKSKGYSQKRNNIQVNGKFVRQFKKEGCLEVRLTIRQIPRRKSEELFKVEVTEEDLPINS
jgi:hypothetical protein